MSTDLNREQKRQMRKLGALDEQGNPKRAPRQTAPPRKPDEERTSIPQYFREVRAEMRKVAWPTRQEVINSTIVVLIAIVVMATLIFGFDYASAKAVLFLYG